MGAFSRQLTKSCLMPGVIRRGTQCPRFEGAAVRCVSLMYLALLWPQVREGYSECVSSPPAKTGLGLRARWHLSQPSSGHRVCIRDYAFLFSETKAVYFFGTSSVSFLRLPWHALREKIKFAHSEDRV